MTCCFFLVCVLIPVCPNPADNEQVKDEQRQLVGTWEVQASAVKGVDYPSEVGKRFTIDARGQIRRPDSDEDVVISIKLDPAMRPRHIDFLLTSKKEKSVLVVKGIYRLKGSFLEICAGTPEDDRPTSISKQETGYQLLKRVDSPESNSSTDKSCGSLSPSCGTLLKCSTF
jgi:uncharacterized protein (TIGR03067 family)